MDHFPDLVTANRNSNNVSALFGNGDGSFQAALGFAARSAPVSIAVANLDGDTLPDVVTANRDSYDVNVLLGKIPPASNLNDRFQAAVGYPAVARDIEIFKVKHFCNAVDKNGEGIVNPAAHLICYEAKRPSTVRPQVVTTDQFGELELDVAKQRTQLCVPSQFLPNQPMPPPLPLVDSYELYKVKQTRGTEKFEKREVSVKDSFVDEIVQIKKPVRLGTPTKRGTRAIINPLHHLSCYSLKAPKFEKQEIRVRDVLGTTLTLRVRQPNMLCTPSEKEVVSEDP